MGVEITTAMMSDVFENMGAFFSDINPLVFLIIGVVLALFILEGLVGILETKMEHRREEAELKAQVLREIISPYKRHLTRERKKEIRESLIQEA